MVTLKLSTHVNAPPAVVFATAIDVARWPELIRGVKAVEILTPGPVGVGTRFRETRQLFGRDAVEEMTFAAFDPSRLFTLEAVSCGSRFTSEHRFTADIAGTLLELTLRTQPLTLAARLMAPLGRLMTPMMRRMIGADLDDLKRAAEQRAPSDWRVDREAMGRGYEISH